MVAVPAWRTSIIWMDEPALLLIDGGTGTITPYGVVYDNGMKLEHSYDGSHLPEFFFKKSDSPAKGESGFFESRG